MAIASKTPSAFFFIFGIFNFNRNFKQIFSLCLCFPNSCFRLTLLLSYTNRVNRKNNHTTIIVFFEIRMELHFTFSSDFTYYLCARVKGTFTR